MGISPHSSTLESYDDEPGSLEAAWGDSGDESGIRYVGLRATPHDVRSLTLLGHTEPLACSDESYVVVDPSALARRLRDRVLVAARARNIDISIYCTCDELRVAPLAFAQAVHELLDNAVRATRPGHSVVMDVRKTPAGEVIWQLQDDGEGMSPSTLASLGRGTEGGGAGRGVALAWAVVEAHGGLLRFESAPGQGTTASIWLPQRFGAGARRA